MRMAIIAPAGALLMIMGLQGCGPSPPSPAQAVAPARKPGLWLLSVMRDGKPGRLGAMKLCLDGPTDRRVGLIGRRFSSGACRRTSAALPGGGYQFSASCPVDGGGSASIRGVAQGDFKTNYTVHAQVDMTGMALDPMNGRHAVEAAGRFLGPCPADMKPGDVSLGPGMIVNLDRLPKGLGAGN